ncbi:hypothetical protein HMPREF0322_02255 [Desulfitobacterium hafniense DP7]|uniref:Uncharacterized protein n=1 Tax=Desulfitobacterium hafniense DP7 TaxID=537010 RepID=G9XMR7_DESHA|nr:hypothetical protein HMPREF0322_02255 [Desulfitobacterium hafniense DP7]
MITEQTVLKNIGLTSFEHRLLFFFNNFSTYFFQIEHVGKLSAILQ